MTHFSLIMDMFEELQWIMLKLFCCNVKVVSIELLIYLFSEPNTTHNSALNPFYPK